MGYGIHVLSNIASSNNQHTKKKNKKKEEKKKQVKKITSNMLTNHKQYLKNLF